MRKGLGSGLSGLLEGEALPTTTELVVEGESLVASRGEWEAKKREQNHLHQERCWTSLHRAREEPLFLNSLVWSEGFYREKDDPKEKKNRGYDLLVG